MGYMSVSTASTIQYKIDSELGLENLMDAHSLPKHYPANKTAKRLILKQGSNSNEKCFRAEEETRAGDGARERSSSFCIDTCDENQAQGAGEPTLCAFRRVVPPTTVCVAMIRASYSVISRPAPGIGGKQANTNPFGWRFTTPRQSARRRNCLEA